MWEFPYSETKQYLRVGKRDLVSFGTSTTPALRRAFDKQGRPALVRFGTPVGSRASQGAIAWGRLPVKGDCSPTGGVNLAGVGIWTGSPSVILGNQLGRLKASFLGLCVLQEHVGSFGTMIIDIRQ